MFYTRNNFKLFPFYPVLQDLQWGIVEEQYVRTLFKVSNGNIKTMGEKLFKVNYKNTKRAPLT